MRQVGRMWWLLVVVLALVPVGLKARSIWNRPRPQPLDPEMAQVGEMLFKHEWQVKDSLSASGDGLGPVFNATSCVACHNQGGVGGAGGLKHNVNVFTVREADTGKIREGVVHAHAIAPMYQETLAMIDPSMPAISQPSLESVLARGRQTNNPHCTPINIPRHVDLSQRNTPALFGARLIDEISDRDIIALERTQRIKQGMANHGGETAPVGRALRLADGRVGKFGWKAQSSSLSDFVQAACANELGLGNPGQAQPRPLGRPDYQMSGYDLTLEQCNQITAYCASLPRPVERIPADSWGHDQTQAGKKLFATIGCTDCHTPSVGSVEGIYSDLLLHRMGEELVGGGSYNEPRIPPPGSKPDEGPTPGEWRTPPLWGVADSAPYMHDGRGATLEGAIKLHGGQGKHAAEEFARLSPANQAQVLEFLKTLKAP